MPQGTQIQPGALSLRACAAGVGAALAAVLVALATGALAADLTPFVWLGLAVAVTSGCAGLSVQAFLSTAPKGHPKIAQRYLVGMVANFLIQAVALALGCLALFIGEVKFEATAAFGVTFATAVTILHTVGVLVVSRALHARAAAADEASRAPARSVCGVQD